MIKIKTVLGEFVIDAGEIFTESVIIEDLFLSFVETKDVKVWEGDVDYVMGQRMIKLLPGSIILEFEPEPLKDDLVY